MSISVFRMPVLAAVISSCLLWLFSGHAMDQARLKTHADEAIAKYGVTGSNAIIAILDRGIDWKNADFRNPDGTTRIEYIFDTLDNTGANAPGNTWGVGTIYTKAQINAALATNGTLNTRDAVGHGTTTAGIAAGGGRNDTRYRGIAPNAHLIIVKFVGGAPAHDDQPAEANASGVQNLLTSGMDFIVTKAAELGLPCVMLANIGSTGGPGDGTGSLARKVDSTVGPGKPGLAFVTGSSDDGDGSNNNHAGGVVTAGGITTLEIEKVGTGNLRCDLWYAETDRFTVRIHTPTNIFGPYTAPAGPTGFDDRTTSEFNYYHRGRDQDFTFSTSQKRQLVVDFKGVAGSYKIELTGATVVDGRFDAALPLTGNVGDSHFLDHAVAGTIWDMAAARNNICPNAYINWQNYVDIDGIARSKQPPQMIGDLWKGSGVGPTWDGREGMDVSAPGHVVITTYNPSSYWATFRFNLVPSAAGLYGTAGAVSGANPIVTGIVALMLDLDPTLDAGQIKQILRDTAQADTFTGAVPNTRWGGGKVNALAALDRVHNNLTRMSVSLTNNSTLRIAARGQSNKQYFLEQTTDFLVWERVATNLATAGPFHFDVPIGTASMFYRLTR